MATASATSEGTRKPIMPVVAYGVVLALLVMAGVSVFLAGSGDKARPPAREAASSTMADARTARALKLPPRPSSAEKPASEKASPDKIAAEKATAEKSGVEGSPARTAPIEGAPQAKPEPIAAPTTPAAESEKKPEPPKTACKVDLTRWPNDKSDQAQAIQMMLRDLGYYRGTTNGTVGPQTRTAIREFQGTAADGETGEISEALFEALKKKCAASP